MPSSKKSKEATWTEKELLKAIQQDESKRRSDGEKRRSEEKVRKKRDGEPDKKDSEKKSKHRDKENKDEESHRKQKEKHKDEERQRSDRKSEGEKHRTDRKSDGSDGKHKSERRSEGDKHRSSERKSRGERGDEDKGRRGKDTVFDQDIIEHRSLERKDKSKRTSEGDDREKRKHRKEEKERSSDKEKERRRSDKELSKEKHRSSEKKESHRSKESRRERTNDNEGDMKFNLNETYDLEALKRHRESKEKRGDEEKKSSSRSSKSSSSSSKHKEEKVRKKSLSHQPADISNTVNKKAEKKSLVSKERARSNSKVVTFQENAVTKEKKKGYHATEDDSVPVEQCGLLFSETIDQVYEFVASSTFVDLKEPSIQEEVEDDYGYDDDDFEDYDDDDFEDDDEEEDPVEESEGEYSADEEPPTTRSSDNKLSLKTSSSAHEVEEIEPDDNDDGKIAPVQTDLKTFDHKKKSHVRLSATRRSAEGNRTQNSDSLNMNEVLKSISAENERVSSSTSSRNNSRPSTGNERAEKASDSPKIAKKVFGKINFVAAKQKQLNEKTAKKTKKRGQELLKLVQLDQRFIDLFDMPPMTEYELYMKRFGQSGYTQMYTQTHDDDVSQNTQTDEIETVSKWCQCSHDLKSCGTDDDKKDDLNMSGPMNINTARLNEFIVKAGQVMLSLFNELDAGIEQHQRQYTESRTQFSEGYVTLASADFLVLGIADAAAPANCEEIGRAFTHVTYASSQTNMLLAAYGDSKLERRLKNAPKGMIAVWNTNDPTRPAAYLLCESLPTSCCFTSSHSSLVFAGMDDGVVAVWDLNEPASYHKESMVGESKEIFRSATFTTAAMHENHEYPVVAISPILSASSSGMTQKKGAMDMSFQLVSLDQSGILNIWIVVEAHVDSTDLSNVHEDLGLSPCGCIKLSRSATINTLSSIYSSFESLFSATCFQVDLMKPNDVYVGTDQGIIVHALRFGSRPIPKSYKPSKGSGSKVNALDVSPWKLPYFLAGYEDGSVSLFHCKKETSLRTWESFSKGEAIIDVKWSRSRPGTFFAIDAQSVFYIWDVFQTDIQPVFTQMMMRKDKRAVGFSLANDYAGIGIGTPGRSPEMMLMYGDGSIEIHRLSKTLSVMDADELDRMTEYLDNIIPL